MTANSNTNPQPRIRQRARPVAIDPQAEQSQNNDSDLAAPAEGSADYAVGYGKPPAHSRFKPGRSGNPKGRPKGAKGLKTIVRETMTARVTVRTGDSQKRMTRAEAMVHKAAELGAKGNDRLLARVLDLYAKAVPEADAAEQVISSVELSEADEAILAELKNDILADHQHQAGQDDAEEQEP